MKQLGIPQRLITEIFNESKAFLEDIYGIELVELTETKSTKCYITFPCKKLSTSLILNSQSTDDLKILFIVLSYLFMKTGEVQEGNDIHKKVFSNLQLNNIQPFVTVNLIIFLEKLGVNIDEFHKTKEKFIKQLYLKRRKVDIEGQNESHFCYSWGERATLEFNKQDILEVVAKLLNKPATNFVAQHRDAYGDEPTETQDFVMHE